MLYVIFHGNNPYHYILNICDQAVNSLVIVGKIQRNFKNITKSLTEAMLTDHKWEPATHFWAIAIRKYT